MKRSEVENKYKINFERLYKSEEDYNKDYDLVIEKIKKFKQYKGVLTTSSKKLLEALEYYFEVYIIFEKLCVFAFLKNAVDTSDEDGKRYRGKSSILSSEMTINTQFYEIEILNNAKIVAEYLSADEDLKKYEYYLNQIIDQKEHMLSEEEEIILSELSLTGSNIEKVFETLFYQDMTFGKIKDEDNNTIELTNQSFRKLMKSKNRNIRKKAYLQYSKAFKTFENTFASLLNGALSNDSKIAKLKKYDSVLDMSLKSYKINDKFIENYLKVINENKNIYKKYNNALKKYFGYSSLYNYDFGFDNTKSNKEYKIEEALDILYKSFSVYGNDYINKLKEIIKNNSVDFIPTDNKSTGAFAINSYNSGSYACINFQNKIGDISTLAHELGHVMQKELAREVNHVAYADCSFLLVEIASIINEIIFADYVINNSKEKDEKIKVITSLIDTLLGNFFLVGGRLELQNFMYDEIDKGETLTSTKINETQRVISKKFELNGAKFIKENELTWSRVSHNYRNYYNYQYAMGVSIACLFANKILKHDETEIKRYREFLINGGRNYPEITLKNLGIDLYNINIFDSLLEMTNKYIDELEKLI